MKRWIHAHPIGTAAISAVVFLSLGAGVASTEKPKPEVVTKTKRVVVPRTVTEFVDRTPQACIDALDAADRVITIAGDVTAGPIVDLVTAATLGDEAGMQTALEGVDRAGDEVGQIAPTYISAKAACRGANT